jgi:hypothetical protein
MAEKYYVEVDDGSTYWYAWPGTVRTLHRLGGPAIEHAAGYRAWYQNGQLHRTDGPAVENADVYRKWYQNGQLHRTDGPAVEHADGTYGWWLNGTQYTEAAWRAATQPVVEMTVAEIEAALGKRIKIVK